MKAESVLSSALKEAGFSEEVFLEIPKGMQGDFASPIAMRLAKRGGNPLQIAEKIVSKIKVEEPFSDVVAMKPGFINFTLSEKEIAGVVKDIIANPDEWGRSSVYDENRIIVEFTDPNLFKELHIGHFMSNTIGESLSRFFEFGGADVKKVSYMADIGLHIAKSIWGIKKAGLSVEELTSESLADAYKKGSKEYEEDEGARSEIDDINVLIYENKDAEITAIYKKGHKTSMDEFEGLFEMFGTRFDKYFFESDTVVSADKIIKKALGDGILEKSEGAVVYRGVGEGMHTVVFLNSRGFPTYGGKELALPKLKDDYWQHNKSFIVTANETRAHFKTVLSALSKINKEEAEKTKIIFHGILKLPEGKMSSRKGTTFSARQFIDSLREKVKGKSDRNLSDEDVNEITLGAAKYSILSTSSHLDREFVYDKALSINGETGPYLQYASVRARVLLEKAKESDIKIENDFSIINPTLAREIIRFEEVVKESIVKQSPHTTLRYLADLAHSFNSWYEREPILKNDRAGDCLALVRAFYSTMKNGCYLLGIKLPKEM